MKQREGTKDCSSSDHPLRFFRPVPRLLFAKSSMKVLVVQSRTLLFGLEGLLCSVIALSRTECSYWLLAMAPVFSPFVPSS